MAVDGPRLRPLWWMQSERLLGDPDIGIRGSLCTGPGALIHGFRLGSVVEASAFPLVVRVRAFEIRSNSPHAG